MSLEVVDYVMTTKEGMKIVRRLEGVMIVRRLKKWLAEDESL